MRHEDSAQGHDQLKRISLPAGFFDRRDAETIDSDAVVSQLDAQTFFF
jgi:hypothetical protein